MKEPTTIWESTMTMTGTSFDLFINRMNLADKDMAAVFDLKVLAMLVGAPLNVIKSGEGFGMFLKDKSQLARALDISSDFPFVVTTLKTEDDLEELELNVLLAAMENEAAALVTLAGIFSLAGRGHIRGQEYITEIGFCPNNNPDCNINAFADGIFVRAREIAEKHSIPFPDFGITRHRWSNSDEVRAWIGKKLLSQYAPAVNE